MMFMKSEVAFFSKYHYLLRDTYRCHCVYTYSKAFFGTLFFESCETLDFIRSLFGEFK